MFEKLQFYLRHSMNDLRVNGQRTFFALLCIAAGVAAIVSLQTLAVMIQDTLTGNLQENNRGDIQYIPNSSFFVEDEDVLQQGIDKGILSEETISFFGESETEYRVAVSGIEAMQAWLDEHYPGEVEVTYRQPVANLFNIFLGSGTGVSITKLDTGDVVSSKVPVMVDTDVYPYYGEIESKDGQSLSEMINAPTDIVVSEQIADELDLENGDLVRLSGLEQDFTVRGIVETSNEVKNPGQDIFNALNGFYYLDVSALDLFEDINPTADIIFLKIDNTTPEKVVEINEAFNEEFPYFISTTTEDLREDYENLSDAIHDLVSVMGMISLLIGSIGIVNTMQVIVRRRTVEVAVLKTIGLQADQVTTLFLVEAVLMGIIGSVAGILLGWGATFVIKGAAETLLATELPFTIAPIPALNGLIVGIAVTTVFGFLPTLTAGQVRPGIVLRPAQNIVPRAGLLRSFGALLLIVAVLTVIAQSILGSFRTAALLVVGAFFGAAILYVVLNIMVWVVGRFLPAFGIIDLKISLRQMLAGRSRAAVTLLALVVGVFSLSLITLFTDAISNAMEFGLEDAAGGNVTISISDPESVDDVVEIIKAQEGVNSYRITQSYSAEFLGIEEAGEFVGIDALGARIDENMPNNIFTAAAEDDQITQNQSAILASYLGNIGVESADDLPDIELNAGRALTSEDVGQPVVMLVEQDIITHAEIDPGDKLVYQFTDENDEPVGDPFTLEVVGLEKGQFIQLDMSGQAYTFRESLPTTSLPNSNSIVADVDEDMISDVRRAILAIPGTFVLETSLITDLLNSMMSTFTAFPTMVAALGLVVGGVVIANSVALTTMERRREIAVMKAVGLQRERVLGMILLENGVMGLIGGLIGVGIGLVGLIALSSAAGLPSSTVPYGTAMLLMGLCILVALIAALTTAWGASGEKPLNVLRYE